MTWHFFPSSPLACGFGREQFMFSEAEWSVPKTQEKQISKLVCAFLSSAGICLKALTSIYIYNTAEGQKPPRVFICVQEEQDCLTALFISPVDSTEVLNLHKNRNAIHRNLSITVLHIRIRLCMFSLSLVLNGNTWPTTVPSRHILYCIRHTHTLSFINKPSTAPTAPLSLQVFQTVNGSDLQWMFEHF